MLWFRFIPPYISKAPPVYQYQYQHQYQHHQQSINSKPTKSPYSKNPLTMNFIIKRKRERTLMIGGVALSTERIHPYVHNNRRRMQGCAGELELLWLAPPERLIHKRGCESLLLPSFHFSLHQVTAFLCFRFRFLFSSPSLPFFVAPQFEVGRSRVSKCLGVSSTVGRCKLDLLCLCGEGVASCSFLEFTQSWAICHALGVR